MKPLQQIITAGISWYQRRTRKGAVLSQKTVLLRTAKNPLPECIRCTCFEAGEVEKVFFIFKMNVKE